MTSEDAKRMSLTIGSQESLESLGKVPNRPLFVNKASSIKENGEVAEERKQQQQSGTGGHGSRLVKQSTRKRGRGMAFVPSLS